MLLFSGNTSVYLSILHCIIPTELSVRRCVGVGKWSQLCPQRWSSFGWGCWWLFCTTPDSSILQQRFLSSHLHCGLSYKDTYSLWLTSTTLTSERMAWSWPVIEYCSKLIYLWENSYASSVQWYVSGVEQKSYWTLEPLLDTPFCGWAMLQNRLQNTCLFYISWTLPQGFFQQLPDLQQRKSLMSTGYVIRK